MRPVTDHAEFVALALAHGLDPEHVAAIEGDPATGACRLTVWSCTYLGNERYTMRGRDSHELTSTPEQRARAFDAFANPHHQRHHQPRRTRP